MGYLISTIYHPFQQKKKKQKENPIIITLIKCLVISYNASLKEQRVQPAHKVFKALPAPMVQLGLQVHKVYRGLQELPA
jgi:hypothetical protein